MYIYIYIYIYLFIHLGICADPSAAADFDAARLKGDGEASQFRVQYQMGDAAERRAWAAARLSRLTVFFDRLV